MTKRLLYNTETLKFQVYHSKLKLELDEIFFNIDLALQAAGLPVPQLTKQILPQTKSLTITNLDQNW